MAPKTRGPLRERELSFHPRIPFVLSKQCQSVLDLLGWQTFDVFISHGSNWDFKNLYANKSALIHFPCFSPDLNLTSGIAPGVLCGWMWMA